jgi:Ca-activated chloride channel family protein
MKGFPGKINLTRLSAAPTAILAVLFCVIAVSAQDSTSDVHITPRVATAVAPAAAPAPAADGTLNTHTAPIKKKVDLVLVPVTITDPMDRLVTGLDKENFQLFEGKEKQDIQHFSSEDAPVSIGIIFDMSGSMTDKIERAREAVVEFCRSANPQDEFFMITFSDQPRLAAGFTSNPDDIQNKLIFTAPKGRTALLDALYLGMHKMKEAKNQRKALLIISDGGDNHSRYTEQELKSQIKEADVIVYGIGVYDAYFPTMEERLGPQLLSEISQVTGGRTFTIDNPNDLPDVASKIGMELRNQYLLGYKPSSVSHDGKWHKIKVKLRIPRGLPPLQVYARTGYYAPSE